MLLSTDQSKVLLSKSSNKFIEKLIYSNNFTTKFHVEATNKDIPTTNPYPVDEISSTGAIKCTTGDCRLIGCLSERPVWHLPEKFVFVLHGFGH